jgi:WD40 repeat protein
MAIENDDLFIGNFYGVIYYYSLSKERLIKKLTKDEIFMTKKKDRVVNCLLLYENFLFGGFKNGYITIWDVSDKENIYCRFFVDKHERREIIGIGFVNWENKILEFISSDIEGNVYFINVWEGYLYSTIESEKIIINENEDEIFFNICRINISSTDIKKHKLNCTFFFAFCSLYNIYIYQIKPNLMRIFHFKKPFYIISKNVFLNDFSAGFSFIPRNYNDLLDYNKDYKVLNMFYNYTVFAISWEKIITIYAIDFENKDVMQIVPITNYENECAIVRCGFVSNSVVFIVDIKNNIKILNVIYMEPGKYNYNNNININNNIIIGKFCIEEGILFQMILPEDRTKMIKNKMTFNNVIMYGNKKLYILGRKNFYYGMVINWEQFLNKIQKDGKWFDVLKIGLDMFNGKINMLCDIPVDEEERKYKIGFAIKGIILQFILININKNNKNSNNNRNEEGDIDNS